ncbi:ras gtpase-activating protein [Anaeramoeba flamelloides]|uniref:Ras gtpase-activating protein n=1 Tax=Anaeramoeba flamelloides TaxID=1746091 RepID=A0ABQ8ZCM1_9EUKA|nr:ras gtpase-activating protein [Anaeramoeba flamelloides]
MSEIHPDLYVQVLQCRDLFDENENEIKGNLRSELDYFCTVQLDRHQLQTCYKPSTNLLWEEEFLFLVPNSLPDLRIQICSIPQSSNRKKELKIAKLKIPLDTLLDEKPKTEWYPLKFFDQPNSKSTNKPALLLKIHFAFKRLLCNDNFKLLNTFLNVVHSGDRKNLALILIKVLIQYNVAIPFICHTIEYEVENTRTHQNLFRTDSLATRLMGFMAHEVGIQYLNYVLKKNIKQTMKISDKLEIDKNRYKKIENYEKTIKLIEKYSQKYLDTIFESHNAMPTEFLEICKQLKVSVSKKFPKNEVSAISSFLFLRFIAPEIILPRKTLSPNTQLKHHQSFNLRLFGKIFLGFVNGRDVALKDPKLKPLRKWAEMNFEDYKNFIHTVSSGKSRIINKNQKKSAKTKNVVQFKYLLDLYKFLKKYFDKIDTILFVPSEEEKEGTSFHHFLQFDDPAVNLAMILNEFQEPPKRQYQKLHDIPIKKLLQVKAMKLRKTETIELLENFDVDQGILNFKIKFNGQPRKAKIIAQELISLFKQLYEKYFIPDETEKKVGSEKSENSKSKGKESSNNDEETENEKSLLEFLQDSEDIEKEKEKEKEKEREKEKEKEKEKKKKENIKIQLPIFKITNQSDRRILEYFPINWKLISKDKLFTQITELLGELKGVKLNLLNISELITFWINISNSLMVHSCIYNQSPPQNVYHLTKYNSDYKYLIDGNLYSRDDIIHGCLFGGKKYFGKQDPRYKYIIPKEYQSSYFYFAVTDLQKRSPELFCYNSSLIDKQLLFVSNKFLSKSIQFQSQKNDNQIDIILPVLVKYSLKSFGEPDSKILNFIISTLKITNPGLMSKLIQTLKKNYKIKFLDINFPNVIEKNEFPKNIAFQVNKINSTIDTNNEFTLLKNDSNQVKFRIIPPKQSLLQSILPIYNIKNNNSSNK